MARLIHDLKYGHIQENGVVAANLLFRASHYFDILFPADARYVSVPLHPSRERIRGYNQSSVFARSLAEFCGMTYVDALRKIKQTRPQTACSGVERRNNVRGSFLCVLQAVVRGKTIVLCDDVATTGATLEEVARALKQAGAKEVWAITIAH